MANINGPFNPYLRTVLLPDAVVTVVGSCDVVQAGEFGRPITRELGLLLPFAEEAWLILLARTASSILKRSDQKHPTENEKNIPLRKLG